MREDLLQPAEPARWTDVEIGEGVRRTEKQRLRLAPHHAHEQALLPSGSLFDLDRVGQRAEPFRGISLRILAQRRDDELLIALDERRLEQAVRQQNDRQRRDHEDDRVPGGEAQPEPATGFHGGRNLQPFVHQPALRT